MADGSPFPIIIAEWERNAREVVRVAIDQYRDCQTIDVRTWYRDGAALRPGKQGITLSLGHLPKLERALAIALARAKAEGLIGDEDVR